MNILRKILLIIIIIFYNFAILAKIDFYIKESAKCSLIFPYFEKKYRLPKDLLHAVSLQESQLMYPKHNISIVWPWTVNVNSKGYYFRTKAEAVRFTKIKLRAGIKNIDVGCMQVNLKYHPNAFNSIEQAFSPKKNIAYAAKLLKSNYLKSKDWSKAVGNYHSYRKKNSVNYAKKILKISKNIAIYKADLNAHMKNMALNIRKNKKRKVKT